MDRPTVAAQLSGEHPLSPQDAGEACAEIAHRLSREVTAYRLRSSVPGHESSREATHGARPGIDVRVSASAFEACWESTSSFRAPDPLLAACGALRPAGEVRLRFSAAIGGVYMAPPKIGLGRPASRFTAIAFEPAGQADGAPDVRAVAVQTGPHTAHVTMFGEASSGMGAMPGLLGRALGALEGMCEEYAR